MSFSPVSDKSTPHRWPAEDRVLVAELWQQGKTATQIAAHFNARGIEVSRNSIIGIVNRLRAKGVKVKARCFPTAPRISSGKKRAKKSPEASGNLAVVEQRVGEQDQPVSLPAAAPDGYRPIWSLPPVLPRPVAADAPPVGTPLRLNDPWPRDRCRWPIFDGPITSATKIFCGEAREGTGPYCACHAVRARSRVQPATTAKAAHARP